MTGPIKEPVVVVPATGNRLRILLLPVFAIVKKLPFDRVNFWPLNYVLSGRLIAI